MARVQCKTAEAGERLRKHPKSLGVKPMTFDEKFDIAYKASLLRRSGDHEGYLNLMNTLPMLPYMAKFWKEKMGADFLIKGRWDLSEAEAEYGSDWLSK